MGDLQIQAIFSFGIKKANLWGSRSLTSLLIAWNTPGPTACLHGWRSGLGYGISTTGFFNPTAASRVPEFPGFQVAVPVFRADKNTVHHAQTKKLKPKSHAVGNHGIWITAAILDWCGGYAYVSMHVIFKTRFNPHDWWYCWTFICLNHFICFFKRIPVKGHFIIHTQVKKNKEQLPAKLTGPEA